MTKTRLEAFSDGVLAILITIMVLELKAPHGPEWSALRPALPSLLAYVLSFIYLGIYWNNHHHLLHATDRVNGAILWANLHLLFWLSLVPFVTSWLGEEPRAPVPAAAYGLVLLAAAIAYTILARLIIALQGPHSVLARAFGRDRKGKTSLALYVVAIGISFVDPWIADALYVTVALIWFVPDRRIERQLNHA
jgi:TMEM175 potassium channel family protein